jgi:sulfur relay (sulfurtransferase) complex TusBCD TusD component (DsrE family)
MTEELKQWLIWVLAPEEACVQCCSVCGEVRGLSAQEAVTADLTGDEGTKHSR